MVRVGGKLVAMGWRRVEWKIWKSCLGGESESESDWLGRSATRGVAGEEQANDWQHGGDVGAKDDIMGLDTAIRSAAQPSKERECKCQTHATPFMRGVSTRPVVNVREGELCTKGRVRKQIEGAHARRRSERKTMSSPSKLGWRESLRTMRWKKW